MDKSLYTQLDNLIRTMPELAATTLPPQALPWVAQAHGLVYAVLGNSKEVEDLKKASDRLGSIAYRWEAAAQIAAIVHQAQVTARSVVGQAPDWIQELKDPDLLELLKELYGAFNDGYRVLAAIGVRTAFDRATELLNIDPSLSFADKLKKAQSNGHVGVKEKTALEVLINAGSAAAHRGWRPTDKELGAMIDALKSFLRREFRTNPNLVDIKDAVPPRP